MTLAADADRVGVFCLEASCLAGSDCDTNIDTSGLAIDSVEARIGLDPSVGEETVSVSPKPSPVPRLLFVRRPCFRRMLFGFLLRKNKDHDHIRQGIDCKDYREGKGGWERDVVEP